MIPFARASQRPEPLYLLFSFLGGAVLLFVLAPLAGMVLKTSAPEIAKTAVDPEVRHSVALTLWTSMAATAILSVGAIPLSYLLARKQFLFKRVVMSIIDLPIVIPHSAAGIAILGIISGDSLMGAAAERAGFRFVGGPAGIITAMAFVSLPFLIHAAREGFAAVPERLEMAALSLGASPTRMFLTISVPLAWRSILSGLILMWARGLSEFGAVAVVAYHPIITPVLIYERFGAFGLKYARPISVLFIAVCLIFFIVVRLLAREQDHAAR